MRNNYRDLFPIEKNSTPINHGSFGKCPLEIINFRNELTYQLESLSTVFFTRRSRTLVESSKNTLGNFVGANYQNIVFVKNATTGVNTVLNSISFITPATVTSGYALPKVPLFFM